MTKLLVTGDWHYMSTTPRARKDDFQEALSTKICEVFDIARENECNGIIVPGDITNSPNMSYSTFANLVTHMKDAPCQIFSVLGNHDMYSHNPDTIWRTPYGLLVVLDCIIDLKCESRIIGNSVRITGCPFSVDTDRNINDYIPPKISKTGLDYYGFSQPTVNIHIAHGMVLESPPPYEMRHTLMSNIGYHPDAPDILIVGHNHTGFGVRHVPRANKNMMTVINPGALCRLTAHPAELTRTVQVCLLTISDCGEIKTELIPLKTAMPGEDVLSREHLEMEAARGEQIREFLALLAEEGDAKFLEVRDIVHNIAGKEKLPPAVVDEALRRIGSTEDVQT
jgi:exonuclease SbcD